MRPGIKLPHRANAYDAGFDIFAGEKVVFAPKSRAQIPLHWTYRLTEPYVVRDGVVYARKLDVVKKGSGPIWLDPQAIIFDAGFQPPLDDPKGIQLIAVNRSNEEQMLNVGDKTFQLVMQEAVIADLVIAELEDLQAIPKPDARGAGRDGSSDGTSTVPIVRTTLRKAREEWDEVYGRDYHPSMGSRPQRP